MATSKLCLRKVINPNTKRAHKSTGQGSENGIIAKEFCPACKAWVEPAYQKYGYIGICPNCGAETKDKTNSVELGAEDFAPNYSPNKRL